MVEGAEGLADVDKVVSADAVHASLEAGMNGHITKPLDRAVIKDAVAAAMG